MKRTYFLVITLTLILRLPAIAQVGSGIELGAGARAMAFANNHTAVVKDLSAVYWNPAALAFLPVREVQVSFDAMRIYGTSEHSGPGLTLPPGAEQNGSRDIMRLSSIGFMTAMQTIQGGLTLAASFDRPYIFDDFTVFTYKVNGETSTSDCRDIGDLNRWSGAMGIQIAPKVGAGLTASFITGSKRAYYFQEKTDGEGWLLYEYDYEAKDRYMGLTIDLGVLYYPQDILKLGMKFNVFTDIGFSTDYSVKQYEYYEDGTDFDHKRRGQDKGRAYTAPSATLGAGLILPWLTAALDFRVTMPHTFSLPPEDAENIPSDAQARYFKFGTGLGLEAPISTLPIVLRAGYSFDEYDLYNMIHKYDGFRIDADDWDNMGRGFWPSKDRHTLSAGAGFFTAGLGLELAYAYQMWGLEDRLNPISLNQQYTSHRAMASVIYRW